MKKFFLIALLVNLLPMVAVSQKVVHGLHFSYGHDVYNTPFMQATVAMQDHQKPVWRSRDAIELSWDMLIGGHFLMRERLALSWDNGSRRIGRHLNYYVPEVWGFAGGNSLTLAQDFGYQRKFANNRITLSAGAGLGATLLTGAAGWVSMLQRIENGDPVDEMYLISYDAIGFVAQPFLGLSYSPVRQISIGLEQRHEFSVQSVYLNSRHTLYDGNNFIMAEDEKLKNYYGRSLSYMPPVIRVGWTFDARKPRIKNLPAPAVPEHP